MQQKEKILLTLATKTALEALINQSWTSVFRFQSKLLSRQLREIYNAEPQDSVTFVNGNLNVNNGIRVAGRGGWIKIGGKTR